MWYYDHVKSDSASHYEISLSFYGGMAMDIAGKEKVISWSASIGIHFGLLIAAAAMGLFAVAATPEKRPIDVEIYDTAAPASAPAAAAQAAAPPPPPPSIDDIQFEKPKKEPEPQPQQEQPRETPRQSAAANTNEQHLVDGYGSEQCVDEQQCEQRRWERQQCSCGKLAIVKTTESTSAQSFNASTGLSGVTSQSGNYGRRRCPVRCDSGRQRAGRNSRAVLGLSGDGSGGDRGDL